jgi:hypothetical protein
MTETTYAQPPKPPAPKPWMQRRGLVTAVAGGVLAITAFLSGAAVGHAWDGSSSGGTTPFGPGGGRFQNGPFQGGPPGFQNGQNSQNGQVPQAQPARVTWTAGQAPRFDALSLYGVWLTPARVPDPVMVRQSV